MLLQLRRIRPAELDAALLVLPYGHATRLLKFLAAFVARGEAVEFCKLCCCLFIFDALLSSRSAHNTQS